MTRVDRRQEDVGEATITLPEDAGRSQRVFLARVGMLLLIAALLYLVWRIVEPVWQPLLWAVLLGALLAPFTARLAKRLGGKPRLAAGIVTALTLLLFVLPVGIVAGAVAVQAAQLLGKLEGRVPSLENAAALGVARLPWLQQGIDWVGEHTGVTLLQMQGWVIGGVRKLLEAIAASGGSVVLGALGTLVSFLLMLFVLFFVLRDGNELVTLFVRTLPIEEKRRSRLWHHLIEVTRAVFMGIGLTALAQGILLGVGFAFAGLASPLLFGVLGVFFALIPIVGSALLWVPGVLWLVAQGQYGTAAFLTAWCVVVVGTIDNFLRPMLISGRAEVPTLAVFVGVAGGLSAFGFIGLFLGPIVLGLLVALLRFEHEELQSREERA
jgi:predicted PurR-regulated permease PerM